MDADNDVVLMLTLMIFVLPLLLLLLMITKMVASLPSSRRFSQSVAPVGRGPSRDRQGATTLLT